MDPYTDLGRSKVTESVGDLSEEKKQEAIRSGMKRTRELMERELIFGAFLAVKGIFEMTDFFRERMNG